MRGTIFTKSKMNYFGSFGRQRTWALLAQGGDAFVMYWVSLNSMITMSRDGPFSRSEAHPFSHKLLG